MAKMNPPFWVTSTQAKVGQHLSWMHVPDHPPAWSWPKWTSYWRAYPWHRVTQTESWCWSQPWFQRLSPHSHPRQSRGVWDRQTESWWPGVRPRLQDQSCGPWPLKGRTGPKTTFRGGIKFMIIMSSNSHLHDESTWLRAHKSEQGSAAVVGRITRSQKATEMPFKMGSLCAAFAFGIYRAKKKKKIGHKLKQKLMFCHFLEHFDDIVWCETVPLAWLVLSEADTWI